ncbi:MAG: hypothetical protein ACRD15_19620, partial [Vicinamibacterales bacterium]
MDGQIYGARRLGGLLLAVGGAGFLVAGALHPSPRGVETFHDAMVTMLSDPLWPVAHWTALVAGLVLVWALLLLVDGGWANGSVGALAGARLATLGTLFMSVQWAVEIAARSALDTYTGGAAVPIANLIDAMQAVGWPALGFGFALLAASVPASAPRLVVILGSGRCRGSRSGRPPGSGSSHRAGRRTLRGRPSAGALDDLGRDTRPHSLDCHG